jgi:diguanylate cyclase (GGDEF)-like protein
MIPSLDIFTLGLCSTLASSAFGAVFFVLWRRRPEERYLLHWAMSSWIYAVILVALYSPAGHYLASATLLFALMGLTDILIVSGVYSFGGEQPFRRWMVVPVLATSLGHALPLLLHSPHAEAWRALGLGIAMGLSGLAVMREGGRLSPSWGRRIAGGALLTYLPGYLCVIAMGLWFPQTQTMLPLIPMIADQMLLGVLNLGLLAIPAERAHEHLRTAASRDPLTGAWNREGLARFGPDLVQPGGAVIAIDIDHFKAINDAHGHGSGDQVLMAVADAAESLVRQRGGAVFRTGGDEFVAIVPRCDAAAGQRIADRLRHANDSDDGLPPWTLSIGIAIVGAKAPDVDDAIKCADEALYRAKAMGRNRAQLIAA